MTRDIKDKVVVITGASSGLGAETARRLAKEGAKLVLGARRVNRLEALAEELHLGKDAVLKTDVTDRRQVQALVEHAVKTRGRIDVMLNNAGQMLHSPLDSLKVDEWDAMVDINVKGVLYGIAAALPLMQKQKSGHFINVSSVAGHTISPGSVIYCATKRAVRVISEGLRQEVKPYGIRTTVISPGAVASELPDHITHPGYAKGMHEYYARHAIPADSFARAVVYAMSQPPNVDINEILYRPTSQEL